MKKKIDQNFFKCVFPNFNEFIVKNSCLFPFLETSKDLQNWETFFVSLQFPQLSLKQFSKIYFIEYLINTNKIIYENVFHYRIIKRKHYLNLSWINHD